MTYLKHTHLPALSIASALLLSACGGGGGGGSTPTPPPTPVADTTAPAVAFSPTTLTVESEAAGASTLTATDAVGVTTGPTVTCTNGGSFNVATNEFTSAAVTAVTESVCTATASDAAGNEGTATLTVTMTVPVPDTTAPVVEFSPATLTVESGQNGNATLTATDNRAVTTGPTVACTNGGNFNVSTNVFTAATVTTETQSVCTAMASDDAGNEGTGTLTVTMSPTPVATTVTLSGNLTYDRVPFPASATSGLDYDNIVEMPIRQAPVQLLNAAGAVIDSTVSDDNGAYSFTVLSGTEVRVRVRSEVQKGAPNEIDLKVVDNTSSDALYALQGGLAEVPANNQRRNLRARSGWGGSSYTTTRAAAPFALLDTIYATLEDFIAVDADVDFPAFNVLWSTRNRAESGNVADGQIGTSSFTVSNGTPVIRILGDADNDTDEYDVHVVVHEFGHYFENSLSRADSIGGPHSSADRLDARVAFGEGWGNALSGMILDDSRYRDSFGAAQGRGFSIDVENNTYSSTGWYSEGSVQSILYDLFDDADDGADTASYGLAPIYGAFTDPDYESTEAFTTIFAFLEALDNQSGIVTSEITALLNAQDISGTTGFGVGETNNGGLPDILPVYETLQTNGTAVAFCSVDNFGDFNKHGNRRFFRVNIPAAGNYRFTMTQTTSGTGDPDFIVYRDGARVGVGGSGDDRSEQQTFALQAGTHVMEAYAFRNIQQGATTGDICYNFTVEAQ